MFSREYLPTTLDASVPSSGQQPSSPYLEQHPSGGLSTRLPELLSDLRLAENEESVSEESVIDKEVTLPDEEITLPNEEKTRTHDEQSDGVCVSDEQSVSEESVPDGEITLPDHSALPDKENMLENELTEEKLFEIFFVALSKPNQIRGENQQGTTGTFKSKTLADLSWKGLLKKLLSKSGVVVR